MVTKEEIAQLKQQIEDHFAAGDMDSLFKVAERLCKSTDGQYAYFLGACYLNGWGTQVSLANAIIYLHKAAEYGDNYDYACYLSAIAHYRCNEFKDAYNWFVKAQEAGVNDSLALFADSAAGCAFAKWDEVRVQFAQSEVTQGAEWVKMYMSVAIEKYMQAAEEQPETMTSALFCGYARVMILLYNMGTTGMLDMDIVTFDSLGGMVAGGLQALGKMLNTEEHDKVLFKCITGAQFIEEHGYPLVAEYLRAFLAILESTRDRSAAAFYRARWHMKRIGEMLIYEKDAGQVRNIFADIDDHYDKAEKKYGATVMNMMRAGQLPDLTKSFLPDDVPAIDSCENFMNMYWSVRDQAQRSPAPSNPVDKVGGFLKKLFK